MPPLKLLAFSFFPIYTIYLFLSLFYLFLSVPVCDVMMVPFEVAGECLVAAHVRDPTARMLHGSHGGLIQQACLLQTHLPLHLHQRLRGGPLELESATLEFLHVTKTLKVALEGGNQSKTKNMSGTCLTLLTLHTTPRAEAFIYITNNYCNSKTAPYCYSKE